MSKELNIIKKWRAQIVWKKDWGWNKELSTIETALKALEIIKEKKVNVDYFFYSCVKGNWSYEDYLDEVNNIDNLEFCGHYCFPKKQPILTQEEYELLKEVLNK